MKGNRKAAQAVVLDWVSAIDKSGVSTNYYKERFAKLTDAQFEKWIEDLENEKEYNYRTHLPKVRGGWTKDKIIRELKKIDV